MTQINDTSSLLHVAVTLISLHCLTENLLELHKYFW